MELSLTKFIGQWLLPPGGLILLTVAGLLIYQRWPRLARGLLISSVSFLYLLSTPLVSNLLNHLLEPARALDEDHLAEYKAQAIVILGGGRIFDAPEYEGDTVSSYTLQRIRYGARLERRSHLPVYVSGGRVLGTEIRAEAELMRNVLQKEFSVPVTEIEDASKTTFENAKFTSEILKTAGIERIFLVTHAGHMPRSQRVFEHFGLQVIPAPTVFMGINAMHITLDTFVPRAFAFHESCFTLHEMLGNLWYRLRYL